MLLALGWVPGFAGPSYPYGLIAGVLVGPLGAVWAANGVKATHLRGALALRQTFARGAVLALVVAGVAVVHGLRIGFCDAGSDFLRLALGPGVGALTACVWGAAVAQWVNARWALYGLALLLPVGGYAMSFVRFYTSPMVFAFDHFAGYFAGTLYDTDLGSLDRLWSYRAGTVGLVTVLSSLVLLAEVPLLMWWRRRGTLALGFAGLSLATVIALRGPQLGHYQTTSSVAAALGDELSSERCDVVFDAALGKANAELLAWECDVHLRELERQLELSAPARIRVFLFASADQKAALMGARHVYVAKPWRQEIYINAAAFPHPVLRHELAHVVAGAAGRGPFKVAGSAWGLVPDPGRIEGIAVMVAPPEDESLTLAQWSAAMKQLGILPPLGGLFQLGFFGTNSSSAYTVAGAFMQWIAQEHGMATITAWYGGASLEVLTGKSFAQLEHDFGAFLDQIAVSTTELAVARARFERPAVLQRPCPHQVDGTLTAGLTWLGRGNCDKALEAFDQVLAMDASALRAELGRAECAQRRDDWQAASLLYQKLAASGFASTYFKAAAWERAGDLAWQHSELRLATELYDKARTRTVDEDTLRQLDIKQYALESASEQERTAVARFFFGPQGQGTFPLYTGNLLGEWVAREASALASYLLGKQYAAANQWSFAITHLQQALRGELQPRVRREALRVVLLASCAVRDGALVQQSWRELASDRALTIAQYEGFHALARRCGALEP